MENLLKLRKKLIEATTWMWLLYLCEKYPVNEYSMMCVTNTTVRRSVLLSKFQFWAWTWIHFFRIWNQIERTRVQLNSLFSSEISHFCPLHKRAVYGLKFAFQLTDFSTRHVRVLQIALQRTPGNLNSEKSKSSEILTYFPRTNTNFHLVNSR